MKYQQALKDWLPKCHLTNHSKCKQPNKPIRTRGAFVNQCRERENMRPIPSAGNHADVARWEGK